jgi:predicted dehydrogenase
VIGAAVVGLGVGEAHARAYVADARTQLRWVYDLDLPRAERVAEELSAEVAHSLDEILADESVAAVSIASFDDAHHEQTLAALESGKHVFVEKPLCRTVDEARMLRQAWEAAGRPALASNLVLRAAPLYRLLREKLDAGELGTPYAFDGDYLYGRLSKITEGWRAGVEDYSVMLGGGIHLVDLMLWLTGQRPVCVSASGNSISTEGTAFRYPDFAAATFEFESGLVGRISANFGSVHPHQHVVRVFGTDGTFLSDDAGARIYGTRDPSVAPQTLDAAAAPESKGALIGAFIDAVERRIGSHGQHELDVICVCVAADSALAGGTPVEVEYV